VTDVRPPAPPPDDDEGLGQAPPPLWGKYRGTVIDNVDIEGLGRLLVDVPTLPFMLLNWALPCIPYAGFQEGFWAIPPIGANVWVEFEGGDPSHVIWTGCFWEPLEAPLVAELAPEDPALVKVFRSETCTLVLNDTPATGGVVLSVIDPSVAVPITLTMTTLGLEIDTGVMNVLVNPEEGITVTAAETVVTVTPEGVEVTTPVVTVLAPEVKVTGAVAIVGDVAITGALQVKGDTNLTGAFGLQGAATIAGEVTSGPAVNVAGTLGVAGEATLAGAVVAGGAVNVGGVLAAEGDVNVLGGAQIEGNLVVVGPIEGIITPPGL